MTDSRLDTIQQLLRLLTLKDSEVSAEEQDGHAQITINVSEADSGVLIGYHGEKIDALQLIINLIWNQNAISYTPAQVDINGYRLRRKQTLEELADKAAIKAIDSGREILLPHLPSYERRIIHLYLESRDDVTTYSEGEADDRRIVVRPNIQTTE